jgi:hypothetical protein
LQDRQRARDFNVVDSRQAGCRRLGQETARAQLAAD